MSRAGYTVEILCECGALLDAGIEPGSMLLVPECEECENADEWPSKYVLLAVYGAPYNWPTAA